MIKSKIYVALYLVLIITSAFAPPFDIAINGSWVIDLGTPLGDVRHVRIVGNRIEGLSEAPCDATRVNDAQGLLFAPGSTDFRSHSVVHLPANRLPFLATH